MAKAIMIQGTMSNVGKSLITAGLCRIFAQDGYRVAPFKSQNMALNSFITEEGLEMGRAQVVQAEAAGIRPSADMNPILLKPTTDVGSQVIVQGVSIGNMKARDYFAYKMQLVPVIMESYNRLAGTNDIIVIEGAGSPAEINLNREDIVNMGMAAMADAPVLLVGDIDRGGVFAQLYGTVSLLKEEDRARVKGLVINKFRGDKTILDPGVVMLRDLCQVPVVGVVPYMNVDVEDEDSLSSELENHDAENGLCQIDIAVIRLPKISNFTDFKALSSMPGVCVRYVTRPQQLKTPDLVILPGTKNTIDDLLWLRQSGLEAAVLKLADARVPVWGICGGYQMLGEDIFDEHGVETGLYCRRETGVERSAAPGQDSRPPAGHIKGMGLLPLTTWFEEEKVRTQVDGSLGELDGALSQLSGSRISGYEIHMGRTLISGGRGPEDTAKLADYRPEPEICRPMAYVMETQTGSKAVKNDGWNRGNVYGTYVHGIFDQPGMAAGLVKALMKAKGIQSEEPAAMDYRAYKEQQYDKLAEELRGSLDMEAVYGLLGLKGKKDHEN